MSRISRLVVLVASVAAVVSAMAGTASAVTWDVTSTGTFDATAPPGTLSSTGINLSCPTATATGSYTAGSFAGAVYSGLRGTVTFGGGCVGGAAPTEATCGFTFTATTQPTVTTVTTGNIDVTCGLTLAANGVKLCHIVGSPHAIYTDNPAPTLDTLTITTSNLNISGASCPAGNNDTATLSHLTFTFTGPGPHIIRTA